MFDLSEFVRPVRVRGDRLSGGRSVSFGEGYSAHIFAVETYAQSILLAIGGALEAGYRERLGGIVSGCIDREAESASTGLSIEEAREVATFDRLLPTLLATHLGQFVAILEGEVVDSDVDDLRLAQRVGRAFPNRFVLTRLVDSDSEAGLSLDSPEGF